MSEHATPPPLGPRDETDFKDGVYWFDGILEGPVGDIQAMRATLPKLAALGLEAVNIEVEGGRFSLLAADGRRTIAAEHGLDLEAVRNELEALIALSPRPEACESTLRATEYGRERARETLFAVKKGTISRVSRERALRAEDAARAALPEPGAVDPVLGRRRKLILVSALTLAGLFMIWQSGVIGALFAPAASDLEMDAGPFTGLLQIEIDSAPLGYEITLRRGSAYPASPRAAREAQEAAPDLKIAGAIGAVADGDLIYIQLLDEKAEPIGGAGQSLRPLLEGEKVHVSTVLQARRGARTIRLALSPGIGHKNM